MSYQKIDLRAELGKLSQGKPTNTPAWLIAKLILDMLPKDRLPKGRKPVAVEELERMFQLPDSRA
ncbi:hypothetical protein [Edaphobacter aggregans]|uniref:hypothetical protein n=1 Tax=Edaphobacter aggregans TaxID=570835 RepID=UPI0012FA250B|nr:hypothetical protein [Edaphobacter aggregans]